MLRRAPPMLGEHTDEVLAELGLAAEVVGMLGQQRYLLAFGTAALHLFGSLALTLLGLKTVELFWVR